MSSPPPPAPWRPPFESHLTTTSTTSFTLSTIAFDRSNPPRPLPRSRTCIFRGFWATPSLDPRAASALQEQGIGLNPPSCVSDCLSLTTDARMEKVEQLRASGGAVECVFWMEGVMTQWRVKGVGCVIGDPRGGEEEERARERVLGASRFVDGDGQGMGKGEDQGDNGDGKWDMDRQVTTYFANLGPGMRGSFKNPPPGRLRTANPDEESSLGRKVIDLNDKDARANFRVMVVVPEEVERLNVETMERKTWTLEGNEWKEVELWP